MSSARIRTILRRCLCAASKENAGDRVAAPAALRKLRLARVVLCITESITVWKAFHVPTGPLARFRQQLSQRFLRDWLPHDCVGDHMFRRLVKRLVVKKSRGDDFFWLRQ